MKTSLLLISIFWVSQMIQAQFTDTSYVEMPGAKIHTVITHPFNQRIAPLVIMIAGSGPTDLNGNQPMMQNNSLRLLSDELVKRDIATLRFDKRAIAKSAVPGFNEADMTIDQLAADVSRLIEFSRSKGFEQIFILGHSEGSLIGLIALQNTKADGFISLAGAGFTADSILKTQLKPQLPEELYNQTVVTIDSLKNGHTVNSFPPMLISLFRPSVQPYLISWFKYDPAQLIAQINCDVLIVQGDKDLQVSVEDANRLAKSTSVAEPVIIPNMNHVLKTIDGDRNENIATYTNPTLPVNTEMVKRIANFINTRLK